MMSMKYLKACLTNGIWEIHEEEREIDINI